MPSIKKVGVRASRWCTSVRLMGCAVCCADVLWNVSECEEMLGDNFSVWRCSQHKLPARRGRVECGDCEGHLEVP